MEQSKRIVPAELRRSRMLSMVQEREFMRVADLSRFFGISEVTVRSDLDHLASDGMVQRVHGGAIVTTSSPRAEQTFEQAESASALEKEAIGRAAAGLISSGETILLDVGTTAAAVARALVARNDLTDVIVFTNGLPIAMTLEPLIPRFTVVVTGGTLRPRQHSLVDPLASAIIGEIHVSTVILGCNGVHPDEGVTNINLPEAAVKRLMVDAAQRCIVVADGTKLGKISVAKVIDISDVDLIVTSTSAPSEMVAHLSELGPDVRVAD
jgi:DeoR family transcriptional regulator of aga operon